MSNIKFNLKMGWKMQPRNPLKKRFKSSGFNVDNLVKSRSNDWIPAFAGKTVFVSDWYWLLYCHSREGGNPEKRGNPTFFETINVPGWKKPTKHHISNGCNLWTRYLEPLNPNSMLPKEHKWLIPGLSGSKFRVPGWRALKDASQRDFAAIGPTSLLHPLGESGQSGRRVET